MLTTADLMAAAKRARDIPSNYRLARILDTTDNTLTRWNTGKGVPDDEHAIKLADLAGLDRGYVIASMRALREPNPVVRREWERMAANLSNLATMVRPFRGGPKGAGLDGVGTGEDDLLLAHNPDGTIGPKDSPSSDDDPERSVRYVK